MTWARGVAEIEALLASGEMERIPHNPRLVETLINDASKHLTSATHIASEDPTGAYELAYDAMRKAAVALLAEQGLRPKSTGGHVAVRDAVTAQFGGEGKAFRSFDWMRRARNDLEYPDADDPGVDADDVTAAIQAATSDLDFSRKLLETAALTMFTP